MIENRNALIEFKNISKSFRIYHNKNTSLKESFINRILRRNKTTISHYPVLKNISFKIYQGETIGIIGQNGTGKSTILKLISKILYPDLGEIIVCGRVSCMIEVGTGFHPDLTGRENVYLYGSILGLSKKEIDKKFDDIVSFAEMHEFIDTAVKNYSSGMYMRLAFSVSVHVEPDILVIDEVLAVGDEEFQKKCIEKIQSYKKEGKTIVFVSHDMKAVADICDRVFLVKKGGEMVMGSVNDMVDLYRKIGNQAL